MRAKLFLLSWFFISLPALAQAISCDIYNMSEYVGEKHYQLPDAFVGRYFFHQLRGPVYGPYELEQATLPAGLEFDAITGALSGYPSESGIFELGISTGVAEGVTLTAHLLIHSDPEERLAPAEPYIDNAPFTNVGVETIPLPCSHHYSSPDGDYGYVVSPRHPGNPNQLANGNFPLLCLIHGQGVGLYEANNYLSLASQIAAYGFVVVLPNLGDNSSNAVPQRAMIQRTACEEMVRLATENTSSKYFGKVNTSKMAAMGHSNGGHATYQAVYRMPIRALILLDEVQPYSATSISDIVNAYDYNPHLDQGPQLPYLFIKAGLSYFGGTTFWQAAPADSFLVVNHDADHTAYLDTGHEPIVAERTKKVATHFIVAFLKRYLLDDKDALYHLAADGVAMLPAEYQDSVTVARNRDNPAVHFKVDDFSNRSSYTYIGNNLLGLPISVSSSGHTLPPTIRISTGGPGEFSMDLFEETLGGPDFRYLTVELFSDHTVTITEPVHAMLPSHMTHLLFELSQVTRDESGISLDPYPEIDITLSQTIDGYEYATTRTLSALGGGPMTQPTTRTISIPLTSFFIIDRTQPIEELIVRFKSKGKFRLRNLRFEQLPERSLPGDLNADCRVDTSDLGLLLGAFGAEQGTPRYKLSIDFNEDGQINTSELGMLLGRFGDSC